MPGADPCRPWPQYWRPAQASSGIPIAAIFLSSGREGGFRSEPPCLKTNCWRKQARDLVGIWRAKRPKNPQDRGNLIEHLADILADAMEKERGHHRRTIVARSSRFRAPTPPRRPARPWDRTPAPYSPAAASSRREIGSDEPDSAAPGHSPSLAPAAPQPHSLPSAPRQSSVLPSSCTAPFNSVRSRLPPTKPVVLATFRRKIPFFGGGRNRRQKRSPPSWAWRA